MGYLDRRSRSGLTSLGLVSALAVASWSGDAAAHAYAFAPDVPPPDPPRATSSRAPTTAEEMPEPDEPPPEPAPEDPVDGVEPAEPTLDSERELSEDRRLAAKKDAFHRHGIGVRGGIVIIPSWILSKWLATHSNALCRGDKVGDFAAERGLLKTDGCNFYIGGEYTYRFSRVFDLVAAMGYQRLKTPDGYWIDRGQYDGTSQSLGGADLTEIDMHLMMMEVDFIARAPLVVTPDFEFALGGGAGIGLGIVFGGAYQTALGDSPWGFTPETGADFTSCQNLNDLADFTRCTPRWDASEDPDQIPPNEADLDTPNPNLFATCTKDKCSDHDLAQFGYRQKQTSVPPVIPVVNLILSARFLIKDAFGITINGGFNTGFYFGGSMSYFFGPKKQDEMGRGPATEARRSSRRLARR